MDGLRLDWAQLRAGLVETNWLKDAGTGFVGRLAIRPLMLIFLNPTRLSPALRQNPAVMRMERPGIGAGMWGPYDAGQNLFLPFETGKHQFRALLVFARSVAAALRSAHALLVGDVYPQRVNAWALGDALGDAVELWLLSRRYGGGLHRMLIGMDLLVAAFYLRTLLAGRDQEFAASLQNLSVASVFPLWYWLFTRDTGRLRKYSSLTFLLLVGYCGPKLVHLMNAKLAANQEMSEHERWDRRIHIASLVLVAVSVFFRARSSLKQSQG